MLDWNKKEKPLQGLVGMGGGVARFRSSAGSKATGGTIVEDGGYTFHVFTSSGAFVANEDLDIKFLIVGGGGAIYPSGQNPSYGGGGGGGGVVYNDSPQPVTNAGGPYPVVVGERMGDDNPHTPGENDNFSGVTFGSGKNVREKMAPKGKKITNKTFAQPPIVLTPQPQPM